MTEQRSAGGTGAPEEEEIVVGEVVDATPAPTAAELGLELPDDADFARDMLLAEIAAAREQSAEYLDALRRLQADFDNYRKRVLREQTDLVTRASGRLVEALLPVLDGFDAALSHLAEAPEAVRDGIAGLGRELAAVLERDGLVRVGAIGDPFDPHIHEAVASDGGEGEARVGEIFRAGYQLGGKVLRPAMVTVVHA